jgi:pimeloyl-ACP methyl ester carboxylesterase
VSRRLLIVLAVFAAGVLGGCGSTKSANPEKFGYGRDQVWLFRPSGTPRAAVVFLHGFGGQVEQTPANHRAWIDHLLNHGYAVVYPRYETVGNPAPGPTIVQAVGSALERLGARPPLVVIGYSRGGRLAPDYAALADASSKAAHPAAVIAVFPGPVDSAEQRVDLSTLDPRTRFLILVGDRDRTVGSQGASELLHRLEAAGFPPERIVARIVHSRGSFIATHFAPLGDSTGAREAFWAPADQLVEAAIHRSAQ